MKTFVVHLSEKRRELMTEDLIRGHVAYLRKLTQAGVLSFCGPCKDGTALMILRCANEDAAREAVEGDPFSKADYYASRRIVEIEEANEDNDFLLDDVLAYIADRS